MMKLVHLFSSSSSSKREDKVKIKRKSGGNSCSFGSTTSSSSPSSDESATSPRSVLPSMAFSSSGTKKPAAMTREDLEVALRRVVSSEEELAEMLAETADGAGLVLLEEIAADEGELKETFAVFDADGDGRISAEELRAVLASLGDELCSVDDCRRMIGGVDTDGDGFVCFDEFTRMMTHGRA